MTRCSLEGEGSSRGGGGCRRRLERQGVGTGDGLGQVVEGGVSKDRLAGSIQGDGAGSGGEGTTS